MLTLGIETSCDETAASLLEDGSKVLSSVIATQYDTHAKYGGIVPELASRRHIENIDFVISEALKKASVGIKDIDLFAVTNRPGLLGALLIGLSTAKGLAWAGGKPLVPVHHLHAHILAAGLNEELNFPFLSLVVSGGHTSLFKVLSPLEISEISSTRDDAAGEVFDKVAKMLGLGFPGGPAVEREAKGGSPTRYKLPSPTVKGSPLAFSFSGLKTAVKNLLEKEQSANKADVAASFQSAAIKSLTSKTIRAATEYELKEVILAGGVACNLLLREEMKKEGAKAGVAVRWPEPSLCTDNGAMIAFAGQKIYEANPTDKRFHDFLSLDAYANSKDIVWSSK